MNLATMIEGHDGAAVALVAGAEQVTYGELRRRVGVLRGRLVEAGVQPGDRAGLVAANHPHFVVGYLAILGAGAVTVPLNPGAPAPELESELATVGAELLVVGAGGLDAVAGLERAGLDRAGVRQVLAVDTAGEPDAGDAPIVPRRPGDLAVLMFTAGTAGPAKAAMLTHGNLLANLDQIQRHPGRAIEASDVCLGVLPAFHIFGLNVVLGLALNHGASVLLVERFDATETLHQMAEHHVTLVAGVPTMFTAWASVADDASVRDAFASVRLATSGAAPLPEEVARTFAERFGVVLHQGYGLTEAAPVVTSSLLDRPPRWGSIGVPLPGLRVRLVDDEGEDALPGDSGEIRVKGPNVFGGYWNDPEATRVALTDDGWLRTGDIAVAGDDGELYLVDRAKDLIIVSGFNVYPAEVEEVLLEDPAVSEAAVVGEPHAQTGETVTAYVVPTDPLTPPDGDVLLAGCRARLARYKCPTSITVVPSLPYGLGGKLLRRRLGSERSSRG